MAFHHRQTDEGMFAVDELGVVEIVEVHLALDGRNVVRERMLNSDGSHSVDGIDCEDSTNATNALWADGWSERSIIAESQRQIWFWTVGRNDENDDETWASVDCGRMFPSSDVD